MSIDAPTLFTTLIILTTLVIFLIILSILVCWIKRHRKAQRAALDSEAGQPSRHERRLEAQSDEPIQQRGLMSNSQSIELLPTIQTNDDRTDNWLEKRGSMPNKGGDASVKRVPESYRMFGAKHDGLYRWGWRDEEDMSKMMRAKGSNLIMYKLGHEGVKINSTRNW